MSYSSSEVASKGRSLPRPARRGVLRRSSPSASVQLIEVPLSTLRPSALNVRRTAPDRIEELAALIASQGLLQPLCVTAHVDAATEQTVYEVAAGGRRLRALQRLAADGVMAADAPIACRLVAHERASEVSLAENSGREAMHPADECEAFRALVDAGYSADHIAQRFGVSGLIVQRRLRLANVAPDLLERYRAGEATLEQMQALAVSEDHERQRAVWHGSSGWARHPHQLRARLTEGEVSCHDERVRFVGLAAYEASGGAVRRDLFAEGEEAWVCDPVLLDRLVAQKLWTAADEVRAEGWSWVEPLVHFDYASRAAYRTLQPSERALTSDEQAHLAHLEAEHAQAQAERFAAEEREDGEDADDERWARLDERCEALEDAIRTLQNSVMHWSAEDQARAGAVVTLQRGELLVVRGLIRPEDLEDGTAPSVAPQGGTTLAKLRTGISERLMLSLTAQRTAALQACLAVRQHVALAVLTARLADSVFGSPSSSVLRISASTCEGLLERLSPGIGATRAGQWLADRRAALHARLPESAPDRLSWLLTQTDEALLELLALCTALTLDATSVRAPKPLDESNAIAQAVELDMADWWHVTGETYLLAVPKAQIVEAVSEALGAQAANDLATMKKTDAVLAAEARLAGTRWLPAPLRRFEALVDDEV